MAKKTRKTSGFNYSSRLVEVTQANLGIVCDDFVPGLKLVWWESLEMFMCFFGLCPTTAYWKYIQSIELDWKVVIFNVFKYA